MFMDLIIKRDLFQTDEDFQKLVDLQNIVYNGGSFTINGFKFWYKDNPYGNVISYGAYDGDIMMAHYACIPTKMIIDGREVNGIHSMATVTHPNYRGLGLFKMLAQKTFEDAAKEGYEFVIGVANANSFPGFIKHLGFYLIEKLDVKWGWGRIRNTSSSKCAYKYWTDDAINWRLGKSRYSRNKQSVFGKYGKYPVKTYMGEFYSLSNRVNIPKRNHILKTLKLYIGLGADLSKAHYFNFPKFVKHSPFNLIFKDLTGGNLPVLTKNEIFFQLMDYDVA